MQFYSFISLDNLRLPNDRSFCSLYALGMTDEAYRQLLSEVKLYEVEIFLQDFENEIWRRRELLAMRRELNRRNRNAMFTSRIEFKFLKSLYILIKRRNIASILFAEKLMNYSKI